MVFFLALLRAFGFGGGFVTAGFVVYRCLLFVEGGWRTELSSKGEEGD